MLELVRQDADELRPRRRASPRPGRPRSIRLTPESRRLLDRLAMLAPDPIPNSLLDVAVPGEAADYDALEARAGLYDYSLARACHRRGWLSEGLRDLPPGAGFRQAGDDGAAQASSPSGPAGLHHGAFRRPHPRDVPKLAGAPPAFAARARGRAAADEAGIADPTATAVRSELAISSVLRRRRATRQA